MSVDQFLLSADTTDLNYPEIRPSLDLNFARTKTLDPRITFTRASGGSYVGADGLIKYAGVNEARFDHDPETGESLGLLIEEARTNRTTSSDYSTVILSNVSKSTTVSTTAPDGSNVFAFDANNNTSVTHRINLSNGYTGDATVPHTASFFIKIPPIGSSGQISNNDRLRVLVRWRSSSGSGTGALFDYFQSTQNFRILLAVNAFGPNPPATYNISANSPYYEKWPNGWYRFVFPGAVASNTSADSFGAYDWNISETTAESSGNCSVFLWGAQFEQGSFPTSYIPTQGSTRTRAADNAKITGKNFSEWYRQDEGTFFVDAAEPSAFVAYQAYLTLQGASITDEIRIWRLNLTTATFNHILNNATQGVINLVINTIANKIARSYSLAQGIVGSANGGSNVQATLSSTTPVTSLRIGARGNNTFYGNRTYKRIAYYPKRLPNSQLQALTR